MATSGNGEERTEAVRVAVCSRDGVSVNERFQRSKDYFVFDVGAGAVDFVERRTRTNVHLPPAKDLESIAEILGDCSRVVSTAFNGAARKALDGKGFAVEVGRGEIGSLLREIVSRSPDFGRSKGPLL